MFWEMELCDSKIEKFLTFSQKKAFLIFWEMELFKKTSYILRNGTFQAQKIKKKNAVKKFLIFREMEHSSPKLKKLSYFRRKL